MWRKENVTLTTSGRNKRVSHNFCDVCEYLDRSKCNFRDHIRWNHTLLIGILLTISDVTISSDDWKQSVAHKENLLDFTLKFFRYFNSCYEYVGYSNRVLMVSGKRFFELSRFKSQVWQKFVLDFGFRGKWEYPGVCLPTFKGKYGDRKEGFPIYPREPFEQRT